MTLLTGMTETGQEVPVQVKPDGRIVAEGLTGPEGPQGPQGPAGAEYWKRNGSGDVYLDSGRLAIGTAGPSSLLHLVSSGQPTITIADDGGRKTELRAPDSSANPGFVGTTTNHDLLIQAGINAGGLNVMRFNTAGSERCRLTADGKWLVGTVNSPASASAGAVVAAGGVFLSSPDGSWWRITVSDSGTLSAVPA